MKKKLWTQNYTLLMSGTLLGTVGGTMGWFALSFLVFDETGSTLAAALLIAMDLIPSFLIPLVAAPLMDRLPRKPFVVIGDVVFGILYGLAGWYLLNHQFSYSLYLGFSLLLTSIESLDQLAYNSLYPNLIPEGCEQKGYAVSSTLYPVVRVVVTPLAALLYDKVGVGMILLMQSALSLLAALVESRIQIAETDRRAGEKFTFSMWKKDVCEAISYLKNDDGLKAIYGYMTVTNGVGNGYAPLLVAFFRTAPGFTTLMYSAFTVAEFAGRSLGGLFAYHREIPRKKRFGFAFFVYQMYELMDMILLWIPYPFMLLNRAACGFLGVNSASLRAAAVQKYIPDHLRAKLNALLDVLVSASVAVFSLLMGSLGEVLDYRWCITLSAGITMLALWTTIWRKRKAVKMIYQNEAAEIAEKETEAV